VMNTISEFRVWPFLLLAAVVGWIVIELILWIFSHVTITIG
jgi:hypothetical protein